MKYHPFTSWTQYGKHNVELGQVTHYFGKYERIHGNEQCTLEEFVSRKIMVFFELNTLKRIRQYGNVSLYLFLEYNLIRDLQVIFNRGNSLSSDMSPTHIPSELKSSNLLITQKTPCSNQLFVAYNALMCNPRIDFVEIVTATNIRELSQRCFVREISSIVKGRFSIFFNSFPNANF